MALDAYQATEGDLLTGGRFNTHQFLVDEARNQSGNVAGFAGGMLSAAAAVALFGVAGAPLILIGLAGGVVWQLVWNWSGAADATAGAAGRALQ